MYYLQIYHNRPYQYQKHNKNVEVFNLLFTTLSCSMRQCMGTAMVGHGWLSLAVLYCMSHFMLFCLSISLKAHSAHCSRQFFIHYHGSANLWTGREGGEVSFSDWGVKKLTANDVEISLREQKLQNLNNYLTQSNCKKVGFLDNFRPSQSPAHLKKYKNTISVSVNHWIPLTVLSVTGFFLFYIFFANCLRVWVWLSLGLEANVLQQEAILILRLCLLLTSFNYYHVYICSPPSFTKGPDLSSADHRTVNHSNELKA